MSWAIIGILYIVGFCIVLFLMNAFSAVNAGGCWDWMDYLCLICWPLLPLIFLYWSIREKRAMRRYKEKMKRIEESIKKAKAKNLYEINEHLTSQIDLDDDSEGQV